jgi:hypothetical protein
MLPDLIGNAVMYLWYKIKQLDMFEKKFCCEIGYTIRKNRAFLPEVMSKLVQQLSESINKKIPCQ